MNSNPYLLLDEIHGKFLYQLIFSTFFRIFSYDFIVYAYFTCAATSSTQLMTSQMWLYIEYLILTYSTTILLLHTF